MKIGDIELKHGLCLGPMAGVTDMTYRMLCRQQGCELTCTEMVSAKAILYNNRNTGELLESDDMDRPLAVQLFGSDPDIVSDMALRLEEGPWAIIDFNMGCPVPKIVNNGEGSALMREPKLVEKILSSMVKKLHKPVTIKIRKGWNESEVSAVEIARIAEACGVSAIAVHGRTREQYYAGKADRDIIRQVKSAVSIPVIGNGDIYTAMDAKQMIEETGCDGIMVARGAQGNPWIFSEIIQYLDTGTVPERPDSAAIRDMMLCHMHRLVEAKGEYIGIREMRKHIGWYTKGLPGSNKLRVMINTTESTKELESLIVTTLS